MTRRTVTLAAVVATIGGVVAGPALPRASAQPHPICTTPQSNFGRVADFDNDGVTDLAIGAPGADTGAGSVEVREAGQTIELGSGIATAGDSFGGSLAAVDLDADRCTDLLVGMPGATVDGKPGAGAIQVFFGTPTGFTTGPLLTAGSHGIAGSPQANANFGASLATEQTSYTDDSTDEDKLDYELNLHVGVPGAMVTRKSTSLVGAGAVITMSFIEPAGDRVTTATDSDVLSQGSGLPGSPVAGAHLGAVMNGRLIGAPDEKTKHKVGAGFVTALNWPDDTDDEDDGYSGYGLVNVHGKYAGERLGASLATACAKDGGALLGAPGRTINGHTGAGVIVAMGHLTRKPRIIGKVSADSPHVPGKAGTNRNFGASMNGGCFGDAGVGQLIVGVPGAAVNGHRAAGTIDLLKTALFNPSKVSAGKALSRAQLPGKPTSGAGFGATMTSVSVGPLGEQARLLVGAPGDSVAGRVGAGSLDLLKDNGPIVKPTGSVIRPHQPVVGASYGASLA